MVGLPRWDRTGFGVFVERLPEPGGMMWRARAGCLRLAFHIALWPYGSGPVARTPVTRLTTVPASPDVEAGIFS